MVCGIGLLTNVPYHRLSPAFLFFSPQPPPFSPCPSFSLALPLSLSPPVSLSPNKAAISNWNSMLSRSAHLIYKIKLKASHARMAFCDDEDKEGAYGREGAVSAAHNHLPVMWSAGSWWRHLLPVTCYDVSNATPKTLKLKYPWLWALTFKSFTILLICFGRLFSTCCKVAKHGYRFVPCHRHNEMIYHTPNLKGPANYAL